MKTQEKVLNISADILSRNKEHWISADRLSKLTGLDKRTIRLQLSIALDEGIPIASGNKGYIFTENIELLRRHAARYLSMAKETKQHGDNLLHVARDIELGIM